MKALLVAFSLLLGVASGQTTTTFVPTGSTWRYLDNGSNQGTAWRAVAFDDSTWAQGAAELGYGDGDEATVVSFGPNSSAKYITTYFRKSFTVTNAAAYTSATVRARRDDGVVVYLNGTEIFRSNMPTGTVTHTTLASTAAADEVTLFSGAVNAALLVEGANVIAAEVHQNAASSSDLSFALEFTATIPGVTPTATPQSVAATEDTAKAITLAGTDPQNDPLTFAIVTPPANGALTGTLPALTYTPNGNFAGSDSFTFTASDGTNTSAAATVTITVAGVNDVPVADSQTQTLAEEGSVTFDLSGSDVESPYGMLPHYTQQLHNGNLTAITDGLSGATWNADTGTLFLIRNVSSGGGHSYEYNADGTLVRTITQTGFVDTEAIAWMYGTTYAIAEENDNQRISIVTIAPGATTLNRTAAGNVTYTTPVGSLLNLGIESLCYDAGRDLLYYVCEKPAAGAWPVYILNPQTGATTVLCDLNASVFTAGVATDLSDMAFDRETDTILLLSHESNKIIRVSRAGAVLEQRGFTTALTQAEMLALTPDRLRLFVGGEPKQFTRLGLPAATLTYQIATPPAHGVLSGLPPRLTYTPAPNYHGTDSITFRVNDGTVNSADATVTFNVTPANDPPSGSGISLDAEATEPTLIVLPVSDPDGDALTIQTSPPAHGNLTVDGVTATYTGEAGYTGSDSFTYTVSDGEFTAGPFTVNITVLSFNVAPVASDGSIALDEDTPAAVTLAATDAESDPLTWTVLTQPANGTLSGTVPNLTYTPAANFHGSDSFTFRVNDGQEISNTATVSLTIVPVNDAPVANDGTGSIEASYPLPLTLTGSDVDGDAITFAIVDQPAHGTLSGTAPNVTYTADIEHAGEDTFTFTVSDGTLTSAPATVTINVAPYNLPPVASAGSTTTDEDTAAATVLVASDPESSPLTYNIVTPPANGTLSGTAPNLTYTPALNFAGTDSFTWTASDASKTSAPAAFSITVNPVNDAPAAQSLSIPTETNVPAPITLAGSDVENAPLTFAIFDSPANGTLSGTAPALTYTPNTDFTGSDTFTYTVSDGELTSAPATVSISVTAAALDNLVSSGAVWKYLANGSNQGTAWRAPSFDDTAWPQGPAQLGYGDGGEATVVPYGPDANNRYITTYFRREFTLPNPNVITGPLKLEVVRDDGAVVYLNGTEVFRSNMPAGTIAWNTLASAAVGGADESAFFSTTISSSLLVPGRNVLAVEIHQNAGNSSDLSFDLKLAETIPTITRGPYVQMTGPDRATVRWRTNVATVPVLNYSTTEGALTSTLTGSTAATEHEMHVTGLTPNTRYYYSAGYPLATFASGPTYYFTTHPPADTIAPYRFWVLGDAGTGTANQTNVRNAFYTWNGAAKVDGVLLLGDNVYETGTDLEYQTKFFDIYPTMLRNTTFWPCFGNHDAGNASSATQTGPYYQSFTMPKFGEVGGLASGTKAYYSFDYGNIHFVCLDSEGSSLSSSGAMAQWLQADLAANSREWTVAFWHHPVYSKGGHDSDNAAADSGKMKNMREVMVPILESYGVDLLLFGHEHAYFRTPLVDGHYGTSTTFNPATMLKQGGLGDPAVDGPYQKVDGPNNGAVYTVAGSSGKMDSHTRTMPVLALNLNELGSLVLDVNGRELTSRFLNSSGVVRDTFAIVHNTPPVAIAATLAGSEDAALPVALTASDADSDPLTWEIVTPPAVGSLTGTAPDFTFTPPADFHGSVTLEFRVNDGRSNSPTATVTLNIAPVNDTPLAAAGSVSTSEDTSASVTLTASDVDGDALTYAITTPPAHGTLSGTAPDLTYTPAADWNGTDSFEFTATDGAATSAPALVTITVAAVNDAPLASAQSLTTSEDTDLPVTLAGSDADGDTLSFLVLTLPAHGTLSGTPPALTYTPDADWNGADSFTFSVSDGPGVSEPAMVNITVTPANDAPVAITQSLGGTEDTAVPVILTATDADGDALTFTITLQPAHGTLSGTAPDITYTPDADWNGLDSFSFTASDASGASLPVAVTLEIAPVNDAPLAAAQSVSTDEDTALPIMLSGSDPDGDVLTYNVSTPPSHGTLSGTAPNLTYTPSENFHGSDSFEFTVSDGTETSVPASIAITVTPVNDAPLAAAQSLTGSEDTVLPITLSATDADGDAISYTVTVLPAHGTLSGNVPDLIYTPGADWNGADAFTFVASDGTGTSAPAVVSLSINPVNDAPVPAALALNGTEDTAQPVTLSATDADGDVLTYAVTVPPSQGTFSGTAPDLIYTPAENQNGSDAFTFTVSDGTDTVPAVVSITIAPVNDAPLAAAQALTADEDAAITITLTGSDQENTPLSFAIITPPAHGSLSGVAPDLIYTPEANYHGTDEFTFTVTDGELTSAAAVVSLVVNPVNDTPVAAGISAETAEDTAASITLSGSDTDGDTLSLVVLTPPVHGTLSGTLPALTYTPDADWNGVDTFSYAVTDGTATSEPAVVNVAVTPVNDGPVAAPQTLAGNEDTPLTIALTAADLEGDALTYAVTIPPQHGTLSGTAPDLLYTPEPNYHGADSFSFTASDAEGASHPAEVSITLAPVNDIPAAAPQTLDGNEDTPLAIVLTGTDDDGTPLNFSVTAAPQHGTLSGTAPNFSYTPDSDWNGTDTISFIANDGTADSSPATITLNIASVNDEPVASAQSLSGAEDGAVAITLAATDADGDALVYSITAPPVHGTLSGTAPNLTYTPTADWYGMDSFTFVANDGTADSAPAVVTLDIAAVNDAPVAAAASLAGTEDTAVNFSLSATDADGDALTFNVTVPPANGTLSGTAPDLTFTPNANWHGSDSIEFTVSDGTATSAPASIAITIAPVNDAPLAAAQALTTAEDAVLNITPGGSDQEGLPLTFTVITLPTHGTLSGVAPDWIYTPGQDYHGADEFTFTVSDGELTSAPASISISVTPVNDKPSAAAVSAATMEDTPANVILSGSDTDGDTLSFVVLTPPAHGTLSGTLPALTYTPDADWNGEDSFTYAAADGAEVSEPATVSLTVAPVNDAPVALGQSLSGTEDNAVPVTLTATDADGDALTYTITQPPAHGTLSGTAPNLTYTPDADWNGLDTFSFNASDAAETSLPVAVTLEISPVNDAPLAAAQSVSTDEDTALPVVLSGSDPDGDVLTFTVTTPPAHGTLLGTAPNLTYTPAENFHGSDSIEFTVSDGTATSAPASIAITVTPVNDAPLASSQALVTDEDTALPLALTGSDADGDTPVYSITIQPEHGTLSGTAPNLTYTPASDFNGADSFEFSLSDGTAPPATAVVSIIVNAVNDAPLAAAVSVETAEDTPANLTLSGTDTDGDTLNFIVLTLPAHGSLSGSGANLLYTPAADWNGTDSFTYAVTDGPEVSAPATVSLTVTPVNDTPVASAQSISGSEDASIPVTVAAVDADGDTLTYTITLLPSHGTLSGTAPHFTYMPDADWNGLDSFSFTAADAETTSLPVAVTLEVLPVNDAPAALAQTLTTNEDTTLPVTLSATDIDAEPLTYTITTVPAHGTLSGTVPDLIYTPEANWSGEDSFSFAVSDGQESSSAVITITVDPVNDAPVANALAVSTVVSTPVALMLSGSDAEGDAIAFTVTSAPAYGTLSGTAPALTYTPNPAWTGDDAFTFTVTDGTGASAPATVAINVAGTSPWQVIVRSGDLLPGAAAGVTTIQPDFVSDAAGRASFRATAGSITGIWTVGSAGLTPVVVQGASVPGITGAVFDAITTPPWAAGDGEILYFARLLPGSGGVTTSTDNTYWLRNGGSTALIAREGSAPPSFPATAKFNALSTVATLEAGGQYAFAASLTTNSSLGITSSSDTGIWGTFGAPPRLMVRENQAAPGASPGLFDTLTSATLSSNGAGQLAVAGLLKTGGAITTANRYGIWVWDDVAGSLAVRGGQQAAGLPAGAVFARPTQAVLGDGALMFYSTLTTGTGGVTTANDTGIWKIEDGATQLVALEGSQMGVFNNLTEGTAINAANEYVFRANLLTTSNNAGVFAASRFTGGVMTMVARKGFAAPGAGSATFTSFDVPWITSDGRELFTATLTRSSATGVNAANDRGLWVRNSGSLALALREGQAVTLTPGDTRTVANITLPAARASGRLPLSEDGRLVVLLTFTDSSTALVYYRLP